MLCGLLAVGAAGHYLRLGGVGLEKVDIGQAFFFIRPVGEEHRAVVVDVTQHSLHVHRHGCFLCEGADHFAVEIAENKPCKVIYRGVKVGQLLGTERVTL